MRNTLLNRTEPIQTANRFPSPMRALPEAHSSCQLPAIFPPGERTKPCRDRSRFRRKSDPLPMASSSYRDRTSEFRSLTETLQKIGGAPAAVNPPEARAGAPGDASPASARSEFNKRAARIGLGISETSQKIARLAKCTWSPSLALASFAPFLPFVAGSTAFGMLFRSVLWKLRCYPCDFGTVLDRERFCLFQIVRLGVS